VLLILLAFHRASLLDHVSSMGWGAVCHRTSRWAWRREAPGERCKPT